LRNEVNKEKVSGSKNDKRPVVRIPKISRKTCKERGGGGVRLVNVSERREGGNSDIPSGREVLKPKQTVEWSEVNVTEV